MFCNAAFLLIQHHISLQAGFLEHQISMALGMHIQVCIWQYLPHIFHPTFELTYSSLSLIFLGVNSPLYDSIHDPEPGWSVGKSCMLALDIIDSLIILVSHLF